MKVSGLTNGSIGYINASIGMLQLNYFDTSIKVPGYLNDSFGIHLWKCFYESMEVHTSMGMLEYINGSIWIHQR